MPFKTMEKVVHPLWVTDLRQYKPINLGGHWGRDQAGFNLSLSGRIWLTDNTAFPCHRDMIDGQGEDKTNLSGIYSWHQGNHELYVYPYLEAVIDRETVRQGLRSLIGVNGIAVGTPVISNESRAVLFCL
ncbi:hypothetical protein D3C79_191180 [compost metagenome]